MYNKQDLLHHLEQLKIDQKGTLLVHSSMKSIGQVEGGADTVLDCLLEYMKDGLLVFPTHTWSYINADHPKFSVNDSPSMVGILTELFRNRPGVVRSWHPTHSVAALGKGAEDFVKDNEKFDTPCARGSSWGKLFDQKATILLIGVDLRRCTYIHSVEEWLDIPDRLTDEHEQLYTITPDGTEIPVQQRRHINHTSEKYGRVEDVFLENEAMYIGKFGDAEVRVCDAAKMADLLIPLLKEKPDLFS